MINNDDVVLNMVLRNDFFTIIILDLVVINYYTG